LVKENTGLPLVQFYWVLIPCDAIDFTMKSMKDMKKRYKRDAHTIVSVAAQMDAATMHPVLFTTTAITF
jgi:hypothetical protein